ncbi:cytochrome P450 CYP82H23-like [Macadamia integrifolia]|uniref:cytochrome P450 CYP82H23-like n=1 Tax=Macadamia integrifolia TaxID=60698 RepID=UPI001C4F7957|nr:cytochrome P450 CYP82H23-like [Macadamia integrifolia]
MEDLLHQSQPILAIIALIFLYHLWRGTRSITHHNTKPHKPQAPEPSGALPIIGHLHLLRGQVPLARTLAAIADKYGPTVTLRLGVHRVLLISGREVIKECFTTQDKVLASRPLVAAGKYLGYNYAVFGFAPLGPYWREIKKISSLELLSKTRLDMLKHVRTNEVDTCIKELYSHWAKNEYKGVTLGPVIVEMNKWFHRLNFNTITKLIAGKRYFGTVDIAGDDEEAQRFERSLKDLARLTVIFVVSDALPCLEWIDLQGHLKAMKGVAKELDGLIGNWLEDHKQKKKLGGDHEQEDFIDVMLSTFPDEEKLIYGYDRDTVINVYCTGAYCRWLRKHIPLLNMGSFLTIKPSPQIKKNPR